MNDWKSRSLLPRLLYIVQCRNRYRPQDNSIEWWKSYVGEFFAPNGVVRTSVKDMPVFQSPNHTIPSSLTCTEVPYEALPRLFQFKYENGVQEELLFLGNVIESPLPTGGTSIICYQAAEHLVFDGYSVVQYGHLKVVFNNALKVQLLDFSVTGYDLHLDHSVIHSELRQLHQLLEARSAALTNLASAPQLDPKAIIEAQNMLQQTAQMTKLFSAKMNSYLSFEWSYIQKVLHFMQMADVIGSMHELFHACKERNCSPLQALQSFTKVRNTGGGAGGAKPEDGAGNLGLHEMDTASGPRLSHMGRDPSPAQTSASPALNPGVGPGSAALRMLASHGGHLGSASGSPQLPGGGGDLGGGGGPHGSGGGAPHGLGLTHMAGKPSPSLLPPSALHQHQQELQAQQQHLQGLLGGHGSDGGGLGPSYLSGQGSLGGLGSGGSQLQHLLKSAASSGGGASGGGGQNGHSQGLSQQGVNMLLHAQLAARMQGGMGGGLGGLGLGLGGGGGQGQGQGQGHMHMMGASSGLQHLMQQQQQQQHE